MKGKYYSRIFLFTSIFLLFLSVIPNTRAAETVTFTDTAEYNLSSVKHSNTEGDRGSLGHQSEFQCQNKYRVTMEFDDSIPSSGGEFTIKQFKFDYLMVSSAGLCLDHLVAPDVRIYFKWHINHPVQTEEMYNDYTHKETLTKTKYYTGDSIDLKDITFDVPAEHVPYSESAWVFVYFSDSYYNDFWVIFEVKVIATNFFVIGGIIAAIVLGGLGVVKLVLPKTGRVQWGKHILDPSKRPKWADSLLPEELRKSKKTKPAIKIPTKMSPSTNKLVEKFGKNAFDLNKLEKFKDDLTFKKVIENYTSKNFPPNSKEKKSAISALNYIVNCLEITQYDYYKTALSDYAKVPKDLIRTMVQDLPQDPEKWNIHHLNHDELVRGEPDNPLEKIKRGSPNDPAINASDSQHIADDIFHGDPWRSKGFSA